MKKCRECGRVYYDDTLNFCLEDGSALFTAVAPVDHATAIYSSSHPRDIVETPTAILPSGLSDATQRTGSWRTGKTGLLILAAVISLACIFAYQYFDPRIPQSDLASPGAREGTKLYGQMSESEQLEFISERAAFIQTQLGDEPTPFDEEVARRVKVEIDYYFRRKDSLSQKPFEEGLRTIYGRASQFAPVIVKAYESRRVPPVLGLYQAMVESEYRDCPEHPHPKGPVGLFQFSRRTAAAYGLAAEDYCNVEKQAEAAARHMSDLISDFGQEKSSWTLALFSFNDGADTVRGYLRQLRAQGVTGRTYWAILKNQHLLQPSVNLSERDYVPRFFAAAILGETPEAFELKTPPLSSIR